MLVVNAVTPNEQTSEYMAAHGCQFIVCSLCFLVVITEIISHFVQRELPCIRQDQYSCQEFLQMVVP